MSHVEKAKAKAAADTTKWPGARVFVDFDPRADSGKGEPDHSGLSSLQISVCRALGLDPTNEFFSKWRCLILAVLIATFGVLAVVYGDANNLDEPPADHRKALEVSTDSARPKAPLVGDLLTLCASIGYGLYQVLYKRYAALPSDPEFELAGAYDPLPDSEDRPAHGIGSLLV